MDKLASLKQEVKRLELENKLKKLGGNHKENVAKVNKVTDQNAGLKKEISELEAKRSAVKETGIRGFFAKAQYNRAINERNAILRRQTALKNIRLQTEIETERAKLHEIKKRSNLTLDTLGGSDSIKRIRTEDIF